eukprot:CAMPEP_0184655690 /NCGR_PEP_ID=MMETSP0308-20130426/14339_1 /TAXON_ID=38269 /ORGANISM="Gloeochaete witrockiana, Strain SAG 46.84" /LENGTH=271 /DNA_ID=CAMNT_0027092373 /DNA_START=333 /DNA_END=1148 /DNA_ORIENTATION=+
MAAFDQSESPNPYEIELARRRMARDYDLSRVDYYEVLGIEVDASQLEVRTAYLDKIRLVHPDLFGDIYEQECVLLNTAYEILGDRSRRDEYNVARGLPLSTITYSMGACRNGRGVFVDEFQCIGCKNCAHVASNSFFIEDNHGRARVFKQDGDSIFKMQEAIDTCPVSCIHWVDEDFLKVLEEERAKQKMLNVGLLMSNLGDVRDVFNAANLRLQKLKEWKADRDVSAEREQKRRDGNWTAWDHMKSYVSTNPSYDQPGERADRSHNPRKQ